MIGDIGPVAGASVRADGSRRVQRFGRGADGIAQGPSGGAHDARRDPSRDAERAPATVRDRVTHRVGHAARSAGASAAGTSASEVSGGVRDEVDEPGEQIHATHAVGHRVVHLHRERGALAVRAVEAFDERELPKRPGPVEARRRDRLHCVEQGPHRARAREPDAAQVEVEVEAGFGHPARRRDAERRRHDPLAQAGDVAGRAIDAPPESLPVGHRVEQRDARRSSSAGSGSFSMFHMSASSSLMW